MGINVMTQAQVLGQGFLLGLGLGVLYDAMRGIRRSCPWRWLWFLLDVTFWIGTAVAVFVHALVLGNGVVRIYHGGAFLLGGVVYLTTASRILLPIFVRSFRWIHGIVRFFLTPAVCAAGKTKKVLKNQKKGFQKWLKWYKINIVYDVDAQAEKEADHSESQTSRHWYKAVGAGAPGRWRHRTAVHEKPADGSSGQKRRAGPAGTAAERGKRRAHRRHSAQQ
ncbi:hypothetical protein E0L15_05055 [Pseudoflavonifractor sp. SW1122]|nr:hypothetical protein [Pseudoflavonifractor sp. SW1122]